MEEGERAGEGEQGEQGAIAGFASCLAASLLKEGMTGKGEEEAVWTIPCSSDCHSHTKVEEPGGSAGGAGSNGGAGGSGGGAGGSGRLCWTPESRGSEEGVAGGVEGEPTCRGPQDCQKMQRASHSDVEEEEAVEVEAEGLRKGTSEPAVWGGGEERRGRRNLLSYFGLRKEGEEAGRAKSIRKTLSGMFHLRRKRGGATKGEGSESSKASSSIFRLPGLRKPRPVPPCQRALPPTPPPPPRTPPPPSTPGSGRSGGSPGVWVGGEEADHAGSLMDFAASIEKVKDHGWYWGPLSGASSPPCTAPPPGEAAERILAPEPDGSFVVRDSSDHHYIFR